MPEHDIGAQLSHHAPEREHNSPQSIGFQPLNRSPLRLRKPLCKGSCTRVTAPRYHKSHIPAQQLPETFAEKLDNPFPTPIDPVARHHQHAHRHSATTHFVFDFMTVQEKSPRFANST